MRVLSFLAAIGLAGSFASQASATPQRESADQILHRILGDAVRGIETDICYPATAEEYAALGKNAILMLRSSSALSTELPLQSVYLVLRGVHVPLHRVALLEKQTDPSSSQTTQVSFYLLPIQLMKTDARLVADFNGQRTGFGISQFSARRGLGADAPAFARLDEYDTPTDPDPDVIARVLAREYPDYFH